MVIGIAGVSRSGKTTLADRIRNVLKVSVEILSLDDFVKPRDKLTRISGHIDWETPEAHDFELLSEAIEKSKQSHDHTIVEGILIFYKENIRQNFDNKLFLKLDKETFSERKKIDDRWGFEPDWYIDHIWQSYLQFGQVAQSDVIAISGKEPISDELINSYIF